MANKTVSNLKELLTVSTIELFVGRIKSVLLRIISKLSWKMKVILKSGFKSM